MTKIQLLPQSLHIVYTSQLAPDADYSVYAEICRVSRLRNAASGVSGVLLFDGQRFCQWLHGDPIVTGALMRSIELDTRHFNVKTQLRTLMTKDSFAVGWRAGFVDSEALEHFNSLDFLSTDQVLTAVGYLLAAADIEPEIRLSGATAPTNEKLLAGASDLMSVNKAATAAVAAAASTPPKRRPRAR